MIDVHVHMAALPTPENGVRLSERMLKGPVLRFVARQMGIPMDDAPAANRRFLEILDGELAQAESVEAAVLLPMDGVYGKDGLLDLGRTDFYIPNDAVLAAVRGRPRLWPGASINPNRRDALEELERVAAAGAVLVKVLPNAQAFDPADSRHRPFYRALARFGLPLLSHIGYEFSLIGQDQSVGEPNRLIPALEEGATVIAAHGCSQGLWALEPHLKTMGELAARFRNFYTDLSALTLPNRAGALLRLRRRPELFERFLFGTDFPLPCFAYPALAAGPGAYLSARKAGNRFDRQKAVLDALGIQCGADFRKIVGR